MDVAMQIMFAFFMVWGFLNVILGKREVVWYFIFKTFIIIFTYFFSTLDH